MVEMKIVDRIKGAWNVLMHPVADLNSPELLEWLGIDSRNQNLISEVTYYTCMKMLSETMGKLPLKYYQETDRGRIRAEPDEMTKLLTIRPNPIMTPTTLWSAVEMNCQHYGNAFVWMRKVFKRKKYGGEYKTLDLWLMQSSYVTVLMDDVGIFGGKGKIYYQYSDPKSGEQYLFKSEDVMHFKTWYSLDGIMGEPVRKILQDTVGGALESQNFMNRLYEQGLTASMAMQYTGDLDEAKRKQLEKKFANALTGPKNAGKVIPVPIGLELTPLKMSLTDAQFFELKKYSALQIAGAFGIKPNQINNYEKSSYANSETQQLAFLVDTMAYRLKMYEEEINYKALSGQKQKDGFFYKFNEKAILRADSQSQMESLTKAVNNGIYTQNEAREYLDKPAKEGGDVLMVNGNYIPITMVGKQYEKGGGDNGGD
uniref:Portal protein n=1 Tax=Siphoviridae sp. ctkJH11 TaxID=2825641 RepID=A0A8S5PRQ9_9CAUD|nr:MAG TPA: portal protein [Siphoviridae sp. ctkJH11]